MYIERGKGSDDQVEDQKLQRQPEVANNLDGKGTTPEEKPGEQQQWSCIREEGGIPATGSGVAYGEMLQTVHASPRKKLKVYKSHEDRISNLPDSVLSHILSRLFTEDAVATSVLSRNWRYKWTCIYDIDLNACKLSSRQIGKQASVQSFYNFLNRILLSNETWRIRTFNLACGWRHSKDVEEWTTAVFRRDVQNLHIVNPCTDSFVSSQCFSGWSSLTKLELRLKCTLGISQSRCFSSLKTLSLRRGVQMKNEESHNTSRVKLIFPVLETLELINCKWVNIDYVEIVAPKLIRFTFIRDSSAGMVCRFLINAPAVTHAHIHHFMHATNFARWTCTTLNGFRNLVRLTLSGLVVVALVEENFDFSPLAQLEELEINRYSYTGKLLEFLHLLPSIRSISLHMRILPSWDAVEVEPFPLALCIRSHLKEFIYTRRNGEMTELDLAMVDIILKNAENLQKVTAIGGKAGKAKLQRQFSKLIPEGSSIDFQIQECNSDDWTLHPISLM